MSDYSSLPTNIPGDSLPKTNYTYLMDHMDFSNFEIISDFLLTDPGSEEDSASTPNIGSGTSNAVFPEQSNETVAYDGGDIQRKSKSGEKKTKTDEMFRVAFRTKSELEIMDDGYKWRKYGKKSVKNSPYPRNYYRCSHGGCHVKKRVERDREDSSYVITTYDGVHNHECPSILYYNEMPFMVPNGWSLQASQSSCS